MPAKKWRNSTLQLTLYKKKIQWLTDRQTDSHIWLPEPIIFGWLYQSICTSQKSMLSHWSSNHSHVYVCACYWCRTSTSARWIDTRRHPLFPNSLHHPPHPIPAQPLGWVIVHRLRPLLHPISFCQVDQPRGPTHPCSCRGHMPVAPEVHSIQRTVPPLQVPRREFAQAPRRRRLHSVQKGNPARWAQRQPRPRRAPAPGEAQRKVHYSPVAGAVRDQNGQGLHFRGHDWIS